MDTGGKGGPGNLSGPGIPRAAAGGAALALLAVLAAGACDAIDPTRVNNPTTTDDDLASAGTPTAALMPGLRAQFARMINAYVVATAVIGDDYSIHGTGIAVRVDGQAYVDNGRFVLGHMVAGEMHRLIAQEEG